MQSHAASTLRHRSSVPGECDREFVGAYVSTGFGLNGDVKRGLTVSPKETLRHSQAGPESFDIGLESASPRQLLAMRKCRDPAQYLGRASDLLRGAHELGIQNKVNIMLYPGEDDDTVRETIDWLERAQALYQGAFHRFVDRLSGTQ